jgi:TolA-binding protein
MNERPDPLPPDIEDLLDEERGARGLVLSDKARLFSRLAATLPIATIPTGGDAPASDLPHAPPLTAGASAASALATKALVAKIAIASVAVLVGGAGGIFVQARYEPVAARPRAAVEAARAPGARIENAGAERALVPNGATTVEAVTSASTPSAAIPSAVKESSVAIAPREDGLKRERVSLEVARTALTRGDFRAAAVALDRHAHEFPRGKLAEERESMMVQTLVGEGKYAEARARALRFRRDFPGSLLQGSVDAALATIP